MVNPGRIRFGTGRTGFLRLIVPVDPGRDEDSFHTHKLRHFQIADTVFEHNGPPGVDIEYVAKLYVRRPPGLWDIIDIFDPVDTIKEMKHT